MPESPKPSSPRRRFISTIVGGTAALAATGGIPRELLGQGGLPTYPPPQGGWDVSWVERIEKAKHKVVFDAAQVEEGVALTNALVYLAGWKEVYNTTDSDMGVAVVIRHRAIQMALNDSIWERWNIGEQLGVRDGDQPAKRNTFAGTSGRSGGDTIKGLMDRGAVVLCCNLALMRSAGQFARAMNMPVEEARKLFIDSMVPGIIRQPNGIFAATRAQEAGAKLMKSS